MGMCVVCMVCVVRAGCRKEGRGVLLVSAKRMGLSCRMRAVCQARTSFWIGSLAVLVIDVQCKYLLPGNIRNAANVIELELFGRLEIHHRLVISGIFWGAHEAERPCR